MRRKRGRVAAGRQRAAGLLCALALAGGLAAQPPGLAPTPEQLREPVPAAPVERAAPRLRVRGEVERAPCPLDGPAGAGVRATVTRVRFVGLAPVAEAAIADSYQPYLGPDRPIATVCRIRDAVATRLRALGYVAAVEVPVQRIADGLVEFRVLYARVTQIRVVGEAGRSQRLFGSLLGRLVDGQPFNRFRAERLILLARDVPGYDVQLTLKPAGTGAGAMVAEVRLGATPVAVTANLSNLAAPATGRFGAQLRADLNGLLGVGDQTSLSVYSTLHTREQQIYQLGERVLLTASGLRLGGRVTYAVTRPDLGRSLAINAHTLLVNGELTQPVRRGQAASLYLAGGLDVLDQNVRFNGQALSRDRLRVGYMRLDFDGVDLAGRGPSGSIGWRVAGAVEVRRGLGVLGAQAGCGRDLRRCAVPGYVPPSVLVGDPRATVVRGAVAVEVHPVRPLLFAVDLRGQAAGASVAAFEQFNLGNYTVGRGYAPGVLVGDQGIAARLEARSRDLALPHPAGAAWQPYAFLDAGRVWRHFPSAVPDHLVSAGGGVRVQWPGRVALDLSGAVPFTTLPGAARRGNPLFLMTLSTSLVPWSFR